MSNNCGCNCKKYQNCDLESESFKPCCNKTVVPCYYRKDPCPLKSFCDPGIASGCNNTPMVNPLIPKRAITTWKINYIVANAPQQAAKYDPDLISPRGIVVYENQVWVANSMSDKITNYDLFGNKLIGAIQVRWNVQISSFPTGLAINCGSGFPVIAINATTTRPATLLTSTKTGDVIAYNPTLDPRRGYVVLSKKSAGELAIYTGISIVNDIMYLANFFQGHIDVFDSNYNRVGIEGRQFVDNYSADPIPSDFRPYNIAYIAPYLYVVYVKIDPSIIVHHLVGPGSGFINVFTLDGAFVKRLYSRGVLNCPWAIIPAPRECGIPDGSFLVNNIGDGRINIISACGEFVGPLIAQSGLPVNITGLQAITPFYTSLNEIFFTASTDIETRGIMGSLVKDQVIYI